MKYAPAPWLFLAAWPTAINAAGIQADTQYVVRPAAFPAVSRHLSLDSLKAEVVQQLERRYGQHYGCSALSLTAIAAVLGSPLTEQQLRSMSDSFSGGIGHKFGEGTCGALTGAIAALGFYASGDKEKHLRLAAEVYDDFKQQQESVTCGDIYGQYGFSHCDGCNRCAVQKVVEVLYREGDIRTIATAPWPGE